MSSAADIDKAFTAVDRRDMATLAACLAAGVDVNVQEPHGRTMLMNAVTHGTLQLVQWLLSHSADPNLQEKAG